LNEFQKRQADEPKDFLVPAGLFGDAGRSTVANVIKQA